MLKDKMWRARDKREAWAPVMTSSILTQTHSNTLSSNFSHPLFHLPASSFKLILSLLGFFLLFCPPLPPLTLQSLAFGCQWDQATARCTSMEKNGWLIQSSLLFLRQECYQRHCKGVLMHCLHAQPCNPFPSSTEIKVLWSGGGGASQSHQRPDRACFSGATHGSECLPSPQGFICESSCDNKEWIISICDWLKRSVSSIKLMFHDLLIA